MYFFWSPKDFYTRPALLVWTPAPSLHAISFSTLTDVTSIIQINRVVELFQKNSFMISISSKNVPGHSERPIIIINLFFWISYLLLIQDYACDVSKCSNTFIFHKNVYKSNGRTPFSVSVYSSEQSEVAEVMVRLQTNSLVWGWKLPAH